MLDFELEIAAVIGTDNEIAGFTLMNDWSARDLQIKEMTVGLGPAKGKDFATSLGPMLVTPDELPYEDGRLHLEATVTVNGEEVTRSDASKQHYTWPQIVEHAARDTELRPGDVIGSGTLGKGCLLELGPLEGDRWLEPGDLVALDASDSGRSRTRSSSAILTEWERSSGDLGSRCRSFRPAWAAAWRDTSLPLPCPRPVAWGRSASLLPTTCAGRLRRPVG